MFNRQNFIKTYANMVARTWTDDSYLQLILSDPVKALASAGIPTPQGAVIRVVQCKISRMGSMDDQVNDWVEGYRTGRFDLYLAIKPDDIDVPPGGGEPGVGGGDVSSCCCTPCCCCT